MKIITVFDDERKEWESLSETEKQEWIEGAEMIKEDYSDILENDEVDFWTLKYMVNSGL